MKKTPRTTMNSLSAGIVDSQNPNNTMNSNGNNAVSTVNNDQNSNMGQVAIDQSANTETSRTMPSTSSHQNNFQFQGSAPANMHQSSSNIPNASTAYSALNADFSDRNSQSSSNNNNLNEQLIASLLSNVQVRPQISATFSTCSARFNGSSDKENVEDFIATILVYKESTHISDRLALISMPLLLEGYASSWWQGVKDEASTFEDAINLLRSAFAPIKSDWRIYSEIFKDKQKPTESTDSFICRKRRLFALLKEKVSERAIIDMIYYQINVNIREKVPREAVKTFQDLLSSAREIELFMTENKTEIVIKPQLSREKTNVRCSYCRKKNHTADVCYKRIEVEKRGKTKDEVKLNCYGCGAAGFYRSNCPKCNYKEIMESPKELNLNSIQTTIVGRNVPTININVNGSDQEAYLDTAARTSIAGYELFMLLKKKEVPFQEVFAEVTLADGSSRKEMVLSTIACILIGKRFKRIRFVCLPKARNNRTLIGIDFLEQCGMVMDLAQRTWHFVDEPSKIFEFKCTPSKAIEKRSQMNASTTKTEREKENVQDFLSWFVAYGEEDPTHPNNVAEFPANDYSPGGITKIFADAIPQDFEIPNENNLFPPLKKMKKQAETEVLPQAVTLNAIDFEFRENEAEHLTESQKDLLKSVINKHNDIFENIVAPIANIEHKINTGNHLPIANPPYRISPAMKVKLKAELDKMLQDGIIEEKESPWAFPVVLIPKKDNEIRLCVDYRKLNAITVTDTYPLPRIDDLLHAAKATPYMSTLDLKSGYWQIKLAEEDKLKTAFTTPFGIFVFNRMPFGLKNAPATFQRIIDKFRSSLPKLLILAYLDDIIICSPNFETHLSDLDQTFEKLKKFGFHLNDRKCFFCRSEVKYLGHILTTSGIKIDPEKSAAIINRPKPKNLKQLMSFLQTCSWFRRFIPDFSKVARPLSNLTKKKATWNWGNEENQAFNKLKQLLSSPPVLQQVQESAPFLLRTDASNYAIGAVLLQGEKDKEHPIEYASRLLIPAERNYSTTEREALAVVWAIQKFRGYVEGSEITILTDHQPLKWLFALKSPTGRLARWSLFLQSYNLRFEYTPGRQNVVADTLSRPPCESEQCCISCECNSIDIDFPRKGSEEFRKSQLDDPELKKIIDSFEQNDENSYRHASRGYIIVDGILYRYCSEQDSENGQLVIPNSLREEILQKYHKDATAGHYGIDKTIARIAPLFYWSGIRSDITKYVKACDECKKYKPSNMKPAGLLQTVSSRQRFEIIAVDLFGPLPRTSNGHQWILAVEDICSRWMELFALKEASAENCALILLNEIILRYGVPRRIHTDNGSQFISALMQKLTFCLGIQQTFTPVYHPEANPVERKNRDLKTQLSICVGKDHTQWNLMLPSIRFAMNTAKCDSTKHTAAYLTFGRELRSPTEVHYDFKAIIKSENFIPQITPHLLRLADTLEIANETQEKMQDKNKENVDRKRKSQNDYQIGDKVLVSTHVLSKASQNLTSKFTPRRDGPYLIIGKKGSACYTIAKTDDPNTPISTHHVSALTPYEGDASAPIYPIRKRGRPKTTTNTNAHQQRLHTPATQHNNQPNAGTTGRSNQHNTHTSTPRRSTRLTNKTNH